MNPGYKLELKILMKKEKWKNTQSQSLTDEDLLKRVNLNYQLFMNSSKSSDILKSAADLSSILDDFQVLFPQDFIIMVIKNSFSDKYDISKTCFRLLYRILSYPSEMADFSMEQGLFQFCIETFPSHPSIKLTRLLVLSAEHLGLKFIESPYIQKVAGILQTNDFEIYNRITKLACSIVKRLNRFDEEFIEIIPLLFRIIPVDPDEICDLFQLSYECILVNEMYLNFYVENNFLVCFFHLYDKNKKLQKQIIQLLQFIIENAKNQIQYFVDIGTFDFINYIFINTSIESKRFTNAIEIFNNIIYELPFYINEEFIINMFFSLISKFDEGVYSVKSQIIKLIIIFYLKSSLDIFEMLNQKEIFVYLFDFPSLGDTKMIVNAFERLLNEVDEGARDEMIQHALDNSSFREWLDENEDDERNVLNDLFYPQNA